MFFKYNNVYLGESFSLTTKMEQAGNIKAFDYVIEDNYFGEKSFEKAEVKMQQFVIKRLMLKNKIDLIYGGDLLNQIGITNYAVANINVPFIGLYAACATFGLGLIESANNIYSGLIDSSLVITSSHNNNSEKQFRFPIEYGGPKPKTFTITATGAVGGIVSKTKSKIKVKSATIGKIVDYQQKDSFNLGVAMAPAAKFTLEEHLTNSRKNIKDYDLILTGDLGEIGQKLLKKICPLKLNKNNYIDAGSFLYKKNQTNYSGASGPAVLPLVLYNEILKKKKYNHILIIATGALHNPTLINQKCSIPCIAHAIELEVLN